MKSWIIQPPTFVRRLFANSLWRLPQGRRRVCLTFDDGPVPEQTPWVLELLKRHNIRATFFCVGENVTKHPELFARLKQNGHVVGNHTYNHLSLSKVGWKHYADNTGKCTAAEGKADYFRPPHGMMLPWRAWQMKTMFRKMVFWDVMPKDYDRRLTPQQVFDNVRRYVRDGSIIVFHDSIKAGDRMRFALEHTIEYLKENGYTFATVEDN